MSSDCWDAAVIGGGPAGLSGALVLGRCRRRVLVLDAGEHRNDRSPALHGFLTRDGTPPSELRAIAREELRRYPGVTLRDVAVTDVQRVADGFHLGLADGTEARARRLLIATGIVDQLPDIPGFDAIYGTSAWVCPICDGWEHRDTPLAVLGTGSSALAFALEMRNWTADLALCSHGPAQLDSRARGRLRRNGIALHEAAIAALEHTQGQLSAIRFADGNTLPRSGLFLAPAWQQRSDIAVRLGCRVTPKGCIETGKREASSQAGIYVAGDASRNLQLAIIAAAEGVTAAVALNADLLRTELAP